MCSLWGTNRIIIHNFNAFKSLTALTITTEPRHFIRLGNKLPWSREFHFLAADGVCIGAYRPTSGTAYTLTWPMAVNSPSCGRGVQTIHPPPHTICDTVLNEERVIIIMIHRTTEWMFPRQMTVHVSLLMAISFVYINSYSKTVLTKTFTVKNCVLPPSEAQRSTWDIPDILNPLNPELNPICYLLALLGAHHFLHVSRIRVKLLTFRWLMSYIYGAPILDVSRSHTTTQHSR